MTWPLSFYIGLRYTRAKRRNHFISFISLASMLGIALGVAVLITVLSVMNGFDDKIRNQFFSIAPHMTVMTGHDISATWPKLQKKIMQVSGVQSAAPYINGKGMLVHEGEINGVDVLGIIPSQEKNVSQLRDKMVIGTLESLQPGQFNILLGQTLASRMGVQVGDKINLFTPQISTTMLGMIPRFKRFTISGIFHTHGFDFDSAVTYINMADAKRLFSGGQMTNGLHVTLVDLYQANKVSKQLQPLLTNNYIITTWVQQFGTFFNALAMEKTMLFIILMLIIAVAVFNLVSTLVMVVNDKRADIAILRTLGASPGTVMASFIVQGAIIGLAGTFIGLLLGLVLAWNATVIVDFVQRVLNVQFVSESVFFVNYLPSKIELADVIKVCLISFGLSLLSTLYPAWMAFKTQPAEALRYE